MKRKRKKTDEELDEQFLLAYENGDPVWVWDETGTDLRDTVPAELLVLARRKFSGLHVLVRDAEKHLDRAEQEFAEHVYAPFWDQVEHAINKLAAYEKGIATINRCAVLYAKDCAETTALVPAFDLPMGVLPDARPTARRLVAVVRKAQMDFHFAQIYEMRKTNKLLVAGFSTLASAIYEIGDVISSSLDELSTSLHRSLDDLLEATRNHAEESRSAFEKQADILTERSKQAAADAAGRRQVEREAAESRKRQEEMLDNIQRKRKPLP
ncbi:MAG: hypothetical protein HYV60_15500 [Planctomycetia bacterium]|nr:hypothetical protein [Planctomycetia bacterium]